MAKKWKIDDDIKIVKRLLKRGDKVLDIGCGYGRVAIPLARSGFDVTGIDIVQKFIKDAKRWAKAHGVLAQFDVGDMIKLPYDNKEFNVIISLWNSFNELFTKKEQICALNEMFRVLAPNGMAFIVLRDSEEKETKKDVGENGGGEDGRVIAENFKGINTSTYIHNKSTLLQICRESNFKKYKTRFKNMNNRRRLILYLYK